MNSVAILDLQKYLATNQTNPLRFTFGYLRSNKAQPPPEPRGIPVAKNAAYPVAVETLKADETLAEATELRQIQSLNNGIEPDHRNIKRIVKPMMGFKSFNSARKTLSGIEAMTMIRKGQAKEISKGGSVSQMKFIEELFGVSA